MNSKDCGAKFKYEVNGTTHIINRKKAAYEVTVFFEVTFLYTIGISDTKKHQEIKFDSFVCCDISLK